MALGAITEYPTGLVSTSPSILYVSTTDTYATVTAAGYLNAAKALGSTFSEDQMALVLTSDDGPVFLQISIDSSGIITLESPNQPGEVTLPTITNHIIVSTNTTGALANLTGTAINNGSLQAGLSGTAGSLISYSSTGSKGYLALTAVANTNDTATVISNAAMGQASTISIPDPGASTANFIVSKLTGTQHITVGAFQVDAGIISSGISTGGTAGGFVSYPATASNGSFAFTPVGNSGNFAAIVSPLSTLGQASTYTLPDPANAAARILVGATATPFTTGHLLASSGTGGLVVDSGVATSAVQLSANIKAQQVASLGGGGAGPLTVTAAGCTTSSVICVDIVASSNTVSVAKVTPGTGNFALTLSGDPGATLTISYIMFIAAQ